MDPFPKVKLHRISNAVSCSAVSFKSLGCIASGPRDLSIFNFIVFWQHLYWKYFSWESTTLFSNLGISVSGEEVLVSVSSFPSDWMTRSGFHFSFPIVPELLWIWRCLYRVLFSRCRCNLRIIARTLFLRRVYSLYFPGSFVSIYLYHKQCFCCCLKYILVYWIAMALFLLWFVSYEFIFSLPSLAFLWKVFIVFLDPFYVMSTYFANQLAALV